MQTRMHSAGWVPSAHLLYGGVFLGVSDWLGGVPCDLYHHAFDVTCMVSLLQLRPVTWQGMLGYIPPPVDRILDTCLWKYYLPATTVAGGNKYWIFAVADPGFSPRGVRQLPKVLLFSFFFCRKLHENERIWTPRGRGRPWRPLGSTNDLWD